VALLGPIFGREWMTLPRRPRHYGLRVAYLSLLWVLGLTAWQALVGWARSPSLGETAQFGAVLFQLYAYLQLTLLTFFGALAAASSIAQEKDRRTFILLLLTDLRNHEIVLGKLVGSLLQLALMLAATAPVLALLLLLGGVAPSQVVYALMVLAGTGLAAGSLGAFVALWRDQTFQALALTVLFLVLYLCVVRSLDLVPWAGSALLGTMSPAPWHTAQQWLDPYLCLAAVLAPSADVEAGVPPALGFAGLMVLLSAVLNAYAIRRLRVWNPSGEPIMQREQPTEDEKEDRSKVHAAPGAVRRVWANPILWREIRTRAYGRRPLLVKLAYAVVLALIVYFGLAPVISGQGHSAFTAASGLLPVAVLSLLLVSAQAVTAITSERDARALDLLLVTDLSPKEFVFGKLGGIAWNVKEYLVPPLALAAVFAGLGALASAPPGHPEMAATRNAFALVAVIGSLVVLLAFVAVLGLHVGLRTLNGRLAVVHTLATVFFLSVGTLVCIWLIVINGRFEYQWSSFLAFIVTGVGGFWWVLNGDRPTTALTVASWACPFAMFYAVINVLIGRPGSPESAEPFLPFLVVAGAFGMAIAAMLVPLLSEFEVALGDNPRE
jgi:ABC-type transport system involved in multi-copper enzyme maturation permease subunit